MYQEYFGLQEPAFSIAVNPRYLYMSQQHKEALAHLLYGVNEGGFVMLTGEVGTGKTTIIRCLLEQLPENTDIAIVLNPMSNVQEMLRTICDEFDAQYDKPSATTKDLTDALHRYLLKNHTDGKNTVLLIDEAQLLSADVLEQIRLLTNLETATQKLLQIVLVGQPELNDVLAQPRLRQLSQRITARFHLTPLTLEETEFYINHRLSVAGMSKDRSPFSPRIIKRIYQFTGGIPRLINVLCERTMIGAYGHNKFHIDRDIFNLAKKEVEGNKYSEIPAGNRQVWFIAAGAAVLVVLAVLLTLILSRSNSVPPPQEIAAPLSIPETIAPTTTRQVSPKPPHSASFSNNNPLNNSAKLEDSASRTGFDIVDSNAAQALLFSHLSFDVSSDTHPCWEAGDSGLKCGTATFSTWSDVVALDRPLILSLITEEKRKSHALLIGLQEQYALLLTQQNKQQIIKLDELGRIWTGEVFYAWRKPKEFREPLQVGSTNKTVGIVAQQFALIDTQATPLSKGKFNTALQERIKIFQRENNLNVDGILGERTLMKLNDALGLSTTLDVEFL